MPRLSIFSFDTLRISPGSIFHLVKVVVVALVMVAAAELIVRLDPMPKALAFESTRTGTIFDYMYQRRPKLNCLFIGSSQCAYNISPADLIEHWPAGSGSGMNAFNMGIPAACISDVNTIYRKLGADFDTDFLVFVVTPSGGLAKSDLRLIDNYGIDDLTGRLSTAERWLSNLYLFRYRRQYRNLRYQVYALIDRNLSGDIKRRLGPYARGWWPGEGRFDSEVDLNQQVDEPNRKRRQWIVPDIVFQSLQRTVLLAQRRGAEVILLVPPHPPRFNRVMIDPDAEWQHFLSRLGAIAQVTGCRVIDHHALVEFTDIHFFDYTHLKNNDARRYSRFLTGSLEMAMHEFEPTNHDCAVAAFPDQ